MKSPRPCDNFRRGRCLRGGNCRYAHPPDRHTAATRIQTCVRGFLSRRTPREPLPLSFSAFTVPEHPEDGEVHSCDECCAILAAGTAHYQAEDEDYMHLLCATCHALTLHAPGTEQEENAAAAAVEAERARHSAATHLSAVWRGKSARRESSLFLARSWGLQPAPHPAAAAPAKAQCAKGASITTFDQPEDAAEPMPETDQPNIAKRRKLAEDAALTGADADTKAKEAEAAIAPAPSSECGVGSETAGMCPVPSSAAAPQSPSPLIHETKDATPATACPVAPKLRACGLRTAAVQSNTSTTISPASLQILIVHGSSRKFCPRRN